MEGTYWSHRHTEQKLAILTGLPEVLDVEELPVRALL
jgi:hypothetical protein